MQFMKHQNQRAAWFIFVFYHRLGKDLDYSFMRNFISTCLLTFVLLGNIGYAQQTVGLFQNSANAFEGYTLFAPLSSNTTFLINNCGQKVHEWQSSSNPGNSVYLLENGDLLHTGRIANSTFNVGGFGGRIELLDWNSTVLWSYDYSSNDHCQHHDVEYLPNGNILLIAWEKKTQAEAVAQGRNPNLLSGGLWPDHILELLPMSPGSASVVWEWHAWDHLVQDFDSLKPNFGVVADHPERINLNYANAGLGGYSDWMHTNSVSYNADLDQIILSVHNFHEVWVIDHSTTSAEAASSTGGNSGKGGDLLYRWGNPIAYDRGTTGDKQFFGQHDAQWIPTGDRYAGQIMVYNNGIQRPGGNHSTIDIIDPPVDSLGNYSIVSNQTFAPALPTWTWRDNPQADFFSSGISGAQRLPGNHTLICEGVSGHLFELDSVGTVIWDYVSPIAAAGPVQQGDPISGNSVFRCLRYAPDYAAFDNHTLTAGDRIELNPLPLPANCTTASIGTPLAKKTFNISPNPFQSEFTLKQSGKVQSTLDLYNLQGQLLSSFDIQAQEQIIEIYHLAKGVYIAKLRGQSGYIKIVKH